MDNKKLYYCQLLLDLQDEEPIIKFIWADSPQEVSATLTSENYAAVFITEITDEEVDSFEL